MFARIFWSGILAAGLLGAAIVPAQEPKGEAPPEMKGDGKKAVAPKGGYKENREAKEPTKDALRAFNSIMSRNGGIIEPENLPAFNSVMRYQLAEFSFHEMQPLLTKKRLEMKNRLKAAGNADVLDAHKQYRNTARAEMAKMIGPEYHPFVRVNAMLVLAELNEKEPSTNNQVPPVGDPESLKIMLAALNDESQLDGVKACAMMGLERHAQVGIPDEKLKLDAIKASLAMLKPGQHEWLRRRAVIALANIGVIGREGEVAKALQDLMANKTENINLRTEAARAFGCLDFASGPRINFAQAVTVIAHLTSDAIAATKPPNGRTDQDMLALETYLTRIEIGLSGKPEPPAIGQERRGPKAGMVLVLTSLDDPQRKLLDEFNNNRFLPLAKLVYQYAPDRADANYTRDLDYAATQVDLWVQVHPLDGAKGDDKKGKAPEKAAAENKAAPKADAVAVEKK